MSDTSQHLSLPFILPSQNQKHVTHNEAIVRLDAIVQLSVVSRSLGTPPASPVAAARYIVGSGSGAWDGQDGAVAAWQDGAWVFLAPRTGWTSWVEDEQALVVRQAAGWTPLQTGGGAADTLGINATADTTNRLTVAAPATLLTNEGAGHQLKINKAAGTDTASLLFQTGFSGRAEMGLAGNDGFSVKVSADGSLFRDAITVDGASGRVSFPSGTAGPALCQLRNTDTTTNINTTAFADVPMNGVEDYRDAGAFALSGNGIRCLRAGRVRVHGQVTGFSGPAARAAFDVSVAINGMRQPGLGQSSYSRGENSHETGSSSITRWVSVAANDVITLQARRAGNSGTTTLVDGQSVLVVEQF